MKETPSGMVAVTNQLNVPADERISSDIQLWSHVSMVLHGKVRRWVAFCNPVKSITTGHSRGQLIALTMIQVCDAAMLHTGELSGLWPAWVQPKQHGKQRHQCGTRQSNTRAGGPQNNGEALEMDKWKASASSPDSTLRGCMIKSSTTTLKCYFVLKS